MAFFNIPMEQVSLTQEDARARYQKMVNAVGQDNASSISALETMRKQIASQATNERVDYGIPKRDMERLNKSIATNLVESDKLNMRNMDVEMQKVISVEGFYHNRYTSPEGGTDTIGIGHKMSPDENAGGYVWIGGSKVPLDNDLSDEQVIQLWEQDELKANEATKRQLMERGINPNSLTDEMYSVAKNLAFNMGTIPRSITDSLSNGDMEGLNKNLLRAIGMNNNTQVVAGLARNRAKSFNMINDRKIVNFEFNRTEDGKTVYTYYDINNEVVEQYTTDKPLWEGNSYDKRYGM